MPTYDHGSSALSLNKVCLFEASGGGPDHLRPSRRRWPHSPKEQVFDSFVFMFCMQLSRARISLDPTREASLEYLEYSNFCPNVAKARAAQTLSMVCKLL